MTRRRLSTSNGFERWLCKQQGILPRSALRYTLEALVPFTEANLKLSFSPGRFFDELQRIDHENSYTKATVKQAYYRAKQLGYISYSDGKMTLSKDAVSLIKSYRPLRLSTAYVMVVFDIPELQAHRRRWFRLLLRELKFKQLQKSVWISEYDCYKVLSAGILEQRLEEYVRVFEAMPVESKSR